MNNKCKSHICIPKFILERFTDSNGRYYYYDIKNKFIGNNGRPKSTNVEIDYYSQETEQLLNTYIESEFSTFTNQLINNKEKNFIIAKEKFDALTKRYVASLMFRSTQMSKSIQQNSITYDLFSKREQHDINVIYGIDAAEKTGILNPYTPYITYNMTKTPFVLPLSGLYSYSYGVCAVINAPISENLSITLIRKENDFEETKCRVILENKTERIHCLNAIAFNNQNAIGEGSVISSNRDELETLKNMFHT